MLAADVPAVIAIEIQANPVPWKAGDFAAFVREEASRQEIENPDRIRPEARYRGPPGPMGWVWAGPEVQGFACALGAADEAELQSIAVAGDRRGRGIGSALMECLCAWARSHGYRALHLEVREGNLAARDFYRRWDFTEAGRRTKYYRDNLEDAVLMTKTL